MPAPEQPQRRRLTGRARAAIGLALALFALVAALIFALGNDDQSEADGPQPSLLVNAAAVAEKPARWLRRDVTVAGEITDVVGPGAYVVGTPGAAAFNGLLVVSREPHGIPQAQRPLLENDSVQVSGEIRTFAREDLEAEFGRGIEDDLTDRNGDPVLVADQILVVPRLLPIGEPATISSILDRPRAHIGSIVSVAGRVTDVYERGALVLDRRIVVLLSRTAGALPGRGDRIRVTGAVRPYDLDELTTRAPDDVDDDLFGDLVERPAIVAYAIERRRR